MENIKSHCVITIQKSSIQPKFEGKRLLPLLIIEVYTIHKESFMLARNSTEEKENYLKQWY